VKFVSSMAFDPFTSPIVTGGKRQQISETSLWLGFVSSQTT
jgi:hypothetical protein